MPIKPVVIQCIGYKNSGKTTLICAMAERLAAAGYRVGAVKHDAHGFEMDRQGTDTWKLGRAGAEQVAITSPNRTAMLQSRSCSLDELLERMDRMDIVLVEGFKQAPYPKLVLIRSMDDVNLLESSANVLAAVSWVPLAQEAFPVFGISETDRIFRLLLDAVVNAGVHKGGSGAC